MSNQDVVKFGDTFYLKHESGQYLVNVDRGRYNWPQLGNTGKVKLRLLGGEGEVQPDSKIKIQTTEEVTGNNNILGAFANSHDCYYWQDGYDEDKQSWRITKASGDAGPIFYGDRVRISNISYSNQRLAPDPKHQGYITTLENAGESWILEPVFVRSVVQPTPAQAPVAVPSVAQPTPAQVTNQYQVQIQRGGSWQEDGMWAIGRRFDSDKTDVINQIYITSNDGGQTLNGNFRDTVPDELSVSVSRCQATHSSGNYYTVVETAAQSSRKFTWVLGSRTDKHVIAIDVESRDGGKTLNGTITYQGEEPIGFKGVRVEGSTDTNVAAADNTIMKDQIKHVVVVMLENRGFDSVLGYLYEPGDEPKHVIAKPGDKKEFHGLSFLSDKEFQALANPLTTKDGQTINQLPVRGVRATNSPGWDPGEPYAHVNNQLFQIPLPKKGEKPKSPDPGEIPTMKGFLQDYSSWCTGDLEAKKQIMHMYTPADLPVLSSLAKTYAVSDMWFASVPTQTNANRAFSICGTSMGLVDNAFLTTNFLDHKFQDDQFQADTIWNVLYDNGFKGVGDWAIFWGENYPSSRLFAKTKCYTRNCFPHLDRIPEVDSHFYQMEKFYEMARRGTLPAFSYIEPTWGGKSNLLGEGAALSITEMSFMGNEYHCPADVTPGEELLKQIYQSLTTNKEAWEKTLLVILFDEHGGTYDHVPPPWGATPPWGSKQPEFNLQYDFQFDRFGVRVPAILVSPLIEEGTVFRSTTNTPYDHTSLIATILKWKGISLNKMGERVSNAPTFDQVLTLTTPRADNLFTLKPPSPGTPLKFGDPFYLKHMSGEYVIGASGKLYYFPRLGQVKKEDLGKVGKEAPVHLDFRFGLGEVKSGATVQIRTSEYLEPQFAKSLSAFAGIRNFLGAWKDQHECYYYSTDDTVDYKQQYWTVSKVGGNEGDPICYGDTVQITSNCPEYKGQRLNNSESLLGGKWLSTAANANDSWVIERPTYQQTASGEVTREMTKL
jgi:phospholipase C